MTSVLSLVTDPSRKPLSDPVTVTVTRVPTASAGITNSFDEGSASTGTPFSAHSYESVVPSGQPSEEAVRVAPTTGSPAMVGAWVGSTVSTTSSAATQSAQVAPGLVDDAVAVTVPPGAVSVTVAPKVSVAVSPTAASGTVQVRVVPSSVAPAGTASIAAFSSTSVRSTVATVDARGTRPVFSAV